MPLFRIELTRSLPNSEGYNDIKEEYTDIEADNEEHASFLALSIYGLRSIKKVFRISESKKF